MSENPGVPSTPRLSAFIIHSFIHSFVHSVFTSPSSVPSPVLGTGDIAVTKVHLASSSQVGDGHVTEQRQDGGWEWEP